MNQRFFTGQPVLEARMSVKMELERTISQVLRRRQKAGCGNWYQG